MIRSITNKDIKNINEIVKDYDNNFVNHYNLKSYINNKTYIINVFEESQIVKGFIIATIIQDVLEILLIFIDTQYRNQKIASSLIENILENHEYERVLLEVSVENEPALTLYKKFNFQVINTRKKYYDGIDAYVMEKIK